MAKRDGNVSNNKARSNKPYDASNSFVKKVASRVSGFIPQSTSWLSGWFSPSSESNQSSSKESRDQLPAEEDDFQDAFEQPPPAKRFRLADNAQFSIQSYNHGSPVPQGESCKRRLPSEFTDMSSLPGPSGLDARGGGFAASTPAMTSMGHQETKTNGGECSESGESTSGCSSLEPQVNRALPNAQGSSQVRQHDTSPRKRLLEDKMNYSLMQNSRSLFLDRSMNSRHNQSVGRRNTPSFCVNTFGSPLFGDRSSLNDLIVNSPFYAGRTTFGGASSSSYRRSVGSASVSSSPANRDTLARHTIKVKSNHSSSTVDTSMSQTARRILATLEQFSTPILDAKRIPVSPQDQSRDNSGTRKRSYSDVNEEPRLLLEQARTPSRSQSRTLHWAGGPPSTSKLTVPVVPDTLVLKRRERLQDSTTAARLMASSAAVTNMTCGLESYKLRTENESNKAKHSLKMKPPSKTRQDRDPKEPELAKEVNLPKIPLPIASLPSFDISVPPPKPVQSIRSTSLMSPQVSASSKSTLSLPTNPVSISSLNSISAQVSAPNSSKSDPTFSFSSPIRVSPSLQDKPLTPISNFSFSSPLPAGSKPTEKVSNRVNTQPKGKDSAAISSGLKPASELKMGSVMDILGKGTKDSVRNMNESASLRDKFKPAASTWECDKCMIRNKNELTRCAACTNPKGSSESKSGSQSNNASTISTSNSVNDSSFGAQFKLSSGMWECSACMVRNKDSNDKCVACCGPKPGCKAATESAPVKPKQTVGGFSGWGDKFKPALNTWECSACMVRNSSELSACQACTTKKPGSASPSVSTANSVSQIQPNWGDKFKKPVGSWQCGDCLIDNKPSDLKCVACQAKKPGTESQPPSPTLNSTPKFSFGIPPTSAGSEPSLSFTFGTSKEKKESEDSKATVTSSTGFKFGEATAAPTTTFTFGVPASISSGSGSAIVNPPSLSTALTVTQAVATTVPAATAVGTLSFKTASISTAPTLSIASPSAAAPVSTPCETVASSVAPVGVSPVTTPLTAPSSQTPSKATGLFGSNSLESQEVKIGSKPADVFPNFKFEQSSSSVSQTLPPPPQPSSSSEGHTLGSPAGGKRKLADDTPSSSAAPFKFGAIAQPDIVCPANSTNASTSSSSVSSTSGPVFSFSGASSSVGLGLATSSATQPASTNNPFPKLVSSPPSSSGKLGPVFSIGTPASKDESVTSTWKQTVSKTAAATAATDLKTSADSSVSSANSKPIFGFGSVSSSGMSFGTAGSNSAPAFSFGTAGENSLSKPAPAFGVPGNSAVPAFNALSTANPVAAPSFGLSATPSFGSSAPATNTSTIFSAPTPFGSSAGNSSTPAFGSAFGVNSEDKKTPSLFNSSADEKKPAFSFGASVDEKKPFSFQASTTTQVSTFQSQTRSVFTFGSSTTATNGPAKPEFSFGASAPSAFPTFNNPQPSTSSTGFNFTAPSQSSSVFGAVNNANPSPSPFGNTPSTNNTLFGSTASSGTSFGSSSQPSGGFNFPAPGTTTFGSQNQTPPAPFTFEPNTKLSFNFTGGNAVNFAATPSDGSPAAPPGRRIRKAMRRTTPR